MTELADEAIERARQLDLLDYLQRYEPQEIVRISHGRYTTRSHDSVKIDHGRWFCWSKEVGGRSALDYLVAVEGWNFRKAVIYLLELEKIPTDEYTLKLPQMEKENRLFALPQKSKGNARVIAYLMRRGIDRDIIDYFFSKGLLYESHPYHNAVFVGLNEKGEPAYAALRSTGQRRFAGEAAGSRKAYAFSFSEGKSATIHVFESAIDLLSYATLKKIRGEDWKAESYISLGGCAFSRGTLPPSLSRMLHEKPNIQVIKLHLDNDRAGRTFTQAIIELLKNDYQVINAPPPCGKDVNDYLMMKLKEIGERSQNGARKNSIYESQRV